MTNLRIYLEVAIKPDSNPLSYKALSLKSLLPVQINPLEERKILCEMIL